MGPLLWVAGPSPTVLRAFSLGAFDRLFFLVSVEAAALCPALGWTLGARWPAALARPFVCARVHPVSASMQRAAPRGQLRAVGAQRPAGSGFPGRRCGAQSMGGGQGQGPGAAYPVLLLQSSAFSLLFNTSSCWAMALPSCPRLSGAEIDLGPPVPPASGWSGFNPKGHFPRNHLLNCWSLGAQRPKVASA